MVKQKTIWLNYSIPSKQSWFVFAEDIVFSHIRGSTRSGDVRAKFHTDFQAEFPNGAKDDN